MTVAGLPMRCHLAPVAPDSLAWAPGSKWAVWGVVICAPTWPGCWNGGYWKPIGWT